MSGEENIEFKPIGVIHSPFSSAEETPIQPVFSKENRGTVEVFDEYSEGLKDIDGFSHIMLIYCFHEAGETELVRRPFMDDRSHGIFAMRHFNRPNPVGLSTVRLLSVEGNVLKVEGIDVLDGTPLLDIKPHIPWVRAPGDVRIGWLEDINDSSKSTRR